IGNFIGTDATGLLKQDGSNVPYANGIGVLIDNGAVNMIGCSTPDERNIISANTDDGVKITGANAVLNVVWGNLIGLNKNGAALGNGGAGVAIYDGSDNAVGLDLFGDGTGNYIANNGGSGVEVKTGSAGPPPAIGNTISENSIYNNTGIGIDLGGDGLVTPNDSAGHT